MLCGIKLEILIRNKYGGTVLAFLQKVLEIGLSIDLVDFFLQWRTPTFSDLV